MDQWQVRKESLPKPLEGGDVFVGYSLKQLEICERIKDIPSLGGAWGGFFRVGFLFIYHGSIFKVDSGYQSFCNKTTRLY